MNECISQNRGLVSIIMPAYNAGLFLQRSINSVKKQTYKNWELLIVDDGSDDNSREIIKGLAKEDERIVLICNVHGGTARARNTAIEGAKGEFIAFIDADDVFHPQFLESLMKAICEEQVDMAICGIARGIDSTEFVKTEIQSGYTVINREEAFSRMYGGEWPLMISPWNKLYSRKLFETIRFPDGRFFEDAATINLTIYASQKICVVKQELYYYYVTPDSSSKTKRSVELMDREWALRSHWEFFLKNKRKELALQAIPFYLTELMIIYYKIKESDRPEDCKQIRKRFKKTYRKYYQKLSISFEQKELLNTFYQSSFFYIWNKIRNVGLSSTARDFIKKQNQEKNVE